MHAVLRWLAASHPTTLDRKLGHLGQVGGKPNLCVQSILSALELLMDSVHINKYNMFCKWFSPLLNSIGTTFELMCLMEHTARGLDLWLVWCRGYQHLPPTALP